MGFWKQLIDFEISLFGHNSVKIVPSAIGPIPDIYENEVKNMQWGVQPPPADQLKKPINPSNHQDMYTDTPGLSLLPQASKISPRQPQKQSQKFHYQTTYNASYQKP